MDSATHHCLMQNVLSSLVLRPFRLTLQVLMCFGLLALGLSGFAIANTNTTEHNEFDWYATLEQNIRTASWRQLSSLEEQIEQHQEHPLHAYLLRAKINRNFTYANRREVEQFLNDYDGMPVVSGIRKRWLKYLAGKNHFHSLARNYRDGMGAELTCHYLRHQIKQVDDPEPYIQQVTGLWLHGKSQPDNCDPLFWLWRKAGYLTPELAFTRISMAAKQGERKLVTYLKRFLPTEQQYLANAWLAVMGNKNQANVSRLFPLKHPDQEAEILVWAIEKLAWQSPLKAVDAYNKWNEKSVFSVPQQHVLRRAISLSMTIDDLPEALTWLNKANVAGVNDDVVQWHIAYLLRSESWQEILTVINQAPDALQQEDFFRYWQARAYEGLGQSEQAITVYQALAQERHYYGFVASARLNQAPTFGHEPAQRNAEVINAVALHPAAVRAKAFWTLQNYTQARREWRYLLSQLSTEEVTQAGILAHEWGWHSRAIVSFAQSGYWDDVERRFPLAHASQFEIAAHEHGISQPLAMAIARRESSFMSDAVSTAGATGLMQVLPSTARYLSKHRVSRNTLFQPQANVGYGAQYLRYLTDKLGNNDVLISASYNAGWRKVLAWLPEDSTVPMDIWIENIPYRETRDYVKAVMAYREIYAMQLNTPSPFFASLLGASAPTYNQIEAYMSGGEGETCAATC